MRLDMHSRQEIVKANYQAYERATKKGRKEILDRLEPVTGMNRSYLATVLGNYGREAAGEGSKPKGRRKERPEGKRGGRPREYREDFTAVLGAIWADYGHPCGKLLVPMIGGMIGFLMADYRITEDIRALLLKVSPAEADLLLRPARKALEIKGVSTTKRASASLRSQVPVQTSFDRETVKPGSFAFDTVAHCGASSSGQFCKTVTGTDVYSGWVEERSLLNSANRWVQEALSNITSELPFPMISAHYDNGMEFINKPLIAWCLERLIRMTRSRPYKKNDNCFAEQKNFDVVRKTVGYFRFDTAEEQAALAEVYRNICPLYNYWYPSFKLIRKEKQANGRYRKIYEKTPKTPFQRLLESPDVSEESKAELRRRKSLYNPAALNAALNKSVTQLLKINREKRQDSIPPLSEGQAVVA
ncbi:MAG: transposase family protein [Treponema sp.]|jgi:hypothetical protein|nr:transposase family protein [Treponema sp.]